jgi:hypothetical protein
MIHALGSLEFIKYIAFIELTEFDLAPFITNEGHGCGECVNDVILSRNCATLSFLKDRTFAA